MWFRYSSEGDGGGSWTLRDIDLTVPAGSKTALVGETGSGKTTLGYLAARLYDVGRGTVTIGGVDVRDLSFKALSDLVGVVSQETYLFHATVRENLRFACPEASSLASFSPATAPQPAAGSRKWWTWPTRICPAENG